MIEYLLLRAWKHVSHTRLDAFVGWFAHNESAETAYQNAHFQNLPDLIREKCIQCLLFVQRPPKCEVANLLREAIIRNDVHIKTVIERKHPEWIGASENEDDASFVKWFAIHARCDTIESFPRFHSLRKECMRALLDTAEVLTPEERRDVMHYCPEVVETHPETSLMMAVHRGDIATVKHMIDAGANVRARNDEIMFQACLGCDASIVKALFDAGASTKYMHPGTLVDAVCQLQDEEFLLRLVESGVQVSDMVLIECIRYNMSPETVGRVAREVSEVSWCIAYASECGRQDLHKVLSKEIRNRDGTHHRPTID